MNTIMVNGQVISAAEFVELQANPALELIKDGPSIYRTQRLTSQKPVYIPVEAEYQLKGMTEPEAYTPPTVPFPEPIFTYTPQEEPKKRAKKGEVDDREPKGTDPDQDQ
jgi:hypothetical protein